MNFYLRIEIIDLLVFLRTDYPPMQTEIITVKMDVPKIGISFTKMRIDRGKGMLARRSKVEKKNRMLGASTQML